MTSQDGNHQQHERNGHAERTHDVERLASVPIDHPERCHGEKQFRDPDQKRRHQRGIDLPAGRLEDSGSVIDDRC